MTDAVFVFCRDMRKEGWELIKDSGETQLFLPNQLECFLFLEKGEEYISGEELVKRVERKQTNLGQRQAEYLLEHKDKIPEEWRQYYLVFPGTIWRFSDGEDEDRLIPCLRWLNGRWFLGFRWLILQFSSAGRVLRLQA